MAAPSSAISGEHGIIVMPLEGTEPVVAPPLVQHHSGAQTRPGFLIEGLVGHKMQNAENQWIEGLS